MINFWRNAGEKSENLGGKTAAPRSSRSIRFSDTEWKQFEKEVRARGMTATELVRHAAVNSLREGFLINIGAYNP